MNFGKFLKSSALFWLVILKTRTPGCLLNVFFTFNLHLLTRRNWHQSTAWKAPVFSHILIGHFGFGFSRIRIFALSNTYTFHEVEVNKKFPGNRKNYFHSEENKDHKIIRNLSFLTLIPSLIPVLPSCVPSYPFSTLEVDFQHFQMDFPNLQQQNQCGINSQLSRRTHYKYSFQSFSCSK